MDDMPLKDQFWLAAMRFCLAKDALEHCYTRPLASSEDCERVRRYWQRAMTVWARLCEVHDVDWEPEALLGQMEDYEIPVM